jgi:hypothetical protein
MAIVLTTVANLQTTPALCNINGILRLERKLREAINFGLNTDDLWQVLLTIAVRRQTAPVVPLQIHTHGKLLDMFLGIIHRSVYISKHDVSETGFCLRLQVKHTQLVSIDRASSYCLIFCSRILNHYSYLSHDRLTSVSTIQKLISTQERHVVPVIPLNLKKQSQAYTVYAQT